MDVRGETVQYICTPGTGHSKESEAREAMDGGVFGLTDLQHPWEQNVAQYGVTTGRSAI